MKNKGGGEGSYKVIALQILVLSLLPMTIRPTGNALIYNVHVGLTRPSAVARYDFLSFVCSAGIS